MHELAELRVRLLLELVMTTSHLLWTSVCPVLQNTIDTEREASPHSMYIAVLLNLTHLPVLPHF